MEARKPKRQKTINTIVQSADLFQLPTDVLKVIATQICDVNDIKYARLVCKSFNLFVNDDHVWRQRFEYCFPDVYRYYQSVDYKSFRADIKMPIIWKEEFITNYLKYCHHFTANQLEDYWAIRSCDVDKIKNILAQPVGLNRVLVEDAQAKSIWQFLRDLPDAKQRQQIYDMLFLAIKDNFEKQSRGFSRLLYALHLFKFDMIEILVVCNQIKEVESFFKFFTLDQESKSRISQLLSLAIKHNHDEIFVLIYTFILKCPELNNKEFLRYFLGEDFGLTRNKFIQNALFKMIVDLNLIKDEESGNNIFHWAALLQQSDFIIHQSATVPDKSELINDRNGGHNSPLEYALHSSYDMIEAMIANGASLRDIEQGSMGYWEEDISPFLIKKIVDNEMGKSGGPFHFMGWINHFIRAGDLDNVRLLMSVGTKISAYQVFNSMNNKLLHVFRELDKHVRSKKFNSFLSKYIKPNPRMEIWVTSLTGLRLLTSLGIKLEIIYLNLGVFFQIDVLEFVIQSVGSDDAMNDVNGKKLIQYLRHVPSSSVDFLNHVSLDYFTASRHLSMAESSDKLFAGVKMLLKHGANPYVETANGNAIELLNNLPDSDNKTEALELIEELDKDKIMKMR